MNTDAIIDLEFNWIWSDIERDLMRLAMGPITELVVFLDPLVSNICNKFSYIAKGFVESSLRKKLEKQATETGLKICQESVSVTLQFDIESTPILLRDRLINEFQTIEKFYEEELKPKAQKEFEDFWKTIEKKLLAEAKTNRKYTIYIGPFAREVLGSNQVGTEIHIKLSNECARLVEERAEREGLSVKTDREYVHVSW